ncbi:FHA domain-containing protein [bacterium]|nr:FHA domain-containing protein [bacterium]
MDKNSANTPSWQQKAAQNPSDSGSDMVSDKLVESDIDGMSYEELMRYLENSGSDILNQKPEPAEADSFPAGTDEAQEDDMGRFEENGGDTDREDSEEYPDEADEETEEDYREDYTEAFDSEAYDSEGYNAEGFDRDGFDREGFDREGYDKEGFDREGYDKEGFDRDNYDREGYDWYGFDCEGFDRGGFDHDGYDPEGYTREDWEAAGYSFNERGEFIMDEDEEEQADGEDDTSDADAETEAEAETEEEYPQGAQTEGVSGDHSAEAQKPREPETETPAEEEYYEENEFDEEGYDAEGYDCEGFDREGFDREGFDRDNYDREGYDWYGFNCEGFDRGGFDRDGYDAEGYTREDWEEAGYSFNERGEFIMDEDEEESEEGGAAREEAEHADESGESREEVSEYSYDESEGEEAAEEYADEPEAEPEAESEASEDSEKTQENLKAIQAETPSQEDVDAKDAEASEEEDASDGQEGSLDDLPPFELAPSPVIKTVQPKRQIPVRGVVPQMKGQYAPPAETAAEPAEPVKDKNDIPVPDVPIYNPESFGTATFAWQYRCDYAIVYESGSQRGKEITLLASEMGKERTLTVGSPGLRANDIEVSEPGIANDQALIRYTSGRFYLINFQRDIKVNDLVLESGEQAPLMSGDLIILGETVLRFRERSANEVLNTYCLEIIESNDHDMVGKTFDLTKKRNTLGRDRNSDIVLPDPEVSRSHCILNNRAGKYFLQHRSETNPTFINGISVTAGGERQINPGDKIQVSSRTILQFKKK